MMHDFGREKTKDVVIFGAAGVRRQAATVLTVAGFCVGGFALDRLSCFLCSTPRLAAKTNAGRGLAAA
jgi:hypothetical protein